MIFYYVILLFLCWPQTRCAEDSTQEEIFDQLATASENVVHAVKLSNESSKNLQILLPSVPSAIVTTVHYENSNGFVPMVPSVATSHDDADNPDSSLQTSDFELNDQPARQSNTTNAVSSEESFPTARKLEEDLAYSSEARIFLTFPESLTNRRSFDLQESQNEFELLKVNNDTPAVANFQDFYENLRNMANTDADSETDTSSSKSVRGNRGKSHVRNYGRQLYQSQTEDPYVQYYSYDNAQDTKKLTYDQEKAASNHQQQDTVNYDGHGQSAARQNVATVPSSSRTNYETNELAYNSGTYDNVAEPSRTHNKFFKPVVVAEPNNYKANLKFGSQLHGSGSNSQSLKTFAPTKSVNHYEAYNDNSRQRSYHRTEDSRGASDESADYSDYVERPRKLPKSRRRPQYSDSSKKPPKDHRDTYDENADGNKNKYSPPTLKSQRYRAKSNPWLHDVSINYDESAEDVKQNIKNTESIKVHRPRPKNTNKWNQISPNLEISHSNGIELDQLEKPKYVLPVKVNFIPIANFDHATALGNSQGFDISNALLRNMVTTAPIGSFTTSSPLLSTSQSLLTAQNLALPKNVVNIPNIGVSTPVPDVIVGQSSFQNPLHTVVLSQPNGVNQNKVVDIKSTNYLPSTMTPVFALTSSLAPTLQNVRFQSIHNSPTSQTAFAVTPSPTTVVQHVPINQVSSGMPQLIMPQPTIQTLQNYLQTPFQTNSAGYQIQLNPHGLQGQNVFNQNGLQIPASSPTTSTLLSGAESRANAGSLDDKKNTYVTAGTNLMASASLAVGQDDQKQVNSYYLHNNNIQGKAQGNHVYHVIKDVDVTPKTKTYLQATQVMPTILHANPTLSSIALNAQLFPQQNIQDGNIILQRSRDQTQYIKLQNNGADDTAQQFQINTNKELLKNHGQSRVTLQTDNMGSNSNNINNVNTIGISSNAHLPTMGTKNVEIVNPNIKPSPVDTTVNTFNTMQYPAVLTTPIPFYSSISPITPQTVNVQSYVNSLTETGTKSKPLVSLEYKASQNQERPAFNPINFVPNVDIIRNQNALNKQPANEPLQPGLNLVPVMPGGNFFKPSYSAQNELIVKPKLTSDLQKYAEEMFKESLKTMYNSHKWNNDRKPQINDNNSEGSDLAKLRIELQKLRASLTESKYKDILEAQSENMLHTTDAPKTIYSIENKKPDPLMTTLEQLLKDRPTGPIHIYHGTVKPGRKHKYSGDSNFGSSSFDDFHSDTHVTEFLTPPRQNNYNSKGQFHDKQMKKRPGGGRYKNGPRKPGRGHSTRHNGIETSASTINLHLDGPFHHKSHFEHDDTDFDRHHSSFDAYPSFTTSPPDALSKIIRELKSKDVDVNHPRMHNLLGLLMKNKQLPSRSTSTFFRDKDHLKQYFENERRRTHQQFYNDAMKDYMLDSATQSDSITNRKVYSGNSTA